MGKGGKRMLRVWVDEILWKGEKKILKKRKQRGCRFEKRKSAVKVEKKQVKKKEKFME